MVADVGKGWFRGLGPGDPKGSGVFWEDQKGVRFSELLRIREATSSKDAGPLCFRPPIPRQRSLLLQRCSIKTKLGITMEKG